MSVELRDIRPVSKSEPLSPLSPGSESFTIDTHTKDEPVEAAKQATRLSWRSLFAFTRWSHAGPLAAAIFTTCMSAALRTVLAIILGSVFDVIADFGGGVSHNDEVMREVSRWCVVLGALTAANWFANSAFLASWIAFGEVQAQTVRRDTFDSLLARDMAWFDTLDDGISSLLTRIQTQTRELQSGTSQLLGQLICDIITSIASLGIAFHYSWRLTLVLIATLPLSAAALWLSGRGLESALQSQKRHLGTASKLATASFTAIDIVKVFNGSEQDTRRYFDMIKEATRYYLLQARANAIQMGYCNFWVIMMFVIGFWYGVALVNDGTQPGNIFTTFYSVLAAFQGVEALMPHLLVLAKGMSAGAFLDGIVKGAREGQDPYSGEMFKPEHCVGAIELAKVSFAYPSNPSRKVLNRSSFFFPAGEMTFIVGRSGSGKSTLGYLISNLAEPSTGEAYLDGQPFWRIDKQWLKANVTLIQQSSVLFDDTVFGNIALGHPTPDEATREEVYTACELAWLQSTIDNLPHGLDTNIGAGGYSLSGGQKQRLALARARLRNPPVLILDEITSGLDQVTKALVMESIRDWRRDKTTIIITHDVSQISKDDFVYVMDNASLVEEGFKRDLLRRCDGYLSHLVAFGPGERQSSAPNYDPPAIAPVSESPNTYGIGSAPKRATLGLSQFIEDFQRFSAQPNRPGISQRASFGLDAYISRAGAEQNRKSVVADALLRLQAPLNIDQEVARERNWFSAFVNERFFSSDEESQLDWKLSSPTLTTFSESLTLKRESKSLSIFTSSKTTSLVDTSQRQTVTSSQIFDMGAPHHQNQSPARDHEEKKRHHSLLDILKTVWPAISPRDRLILLVGLAMCFIGAACTPTFSYCFAQLLGALWSRGDRMAEGMRWALILIGVALTDGITTGIGRYLLERVAQKWVDTIRLQAFDRILGQPKAWFDMAEHSPGRVNECLDRNSEEMRNIVGRFVPIIIYVVGIISISFIWALVISWRLTLVALSPIPVVLGAVKGFSYVSNKWEARCNRGAEDSSALLTEIFLNIRVVKALTLEKHFAQKYTRSIATTLGLGLRRAAYTSPLFGLYQCMNFALIALVFYYATVLLTQEARITVTEVMQVVNLLLFGIGTSTAILSHIPQLTMAQATASQLLEFANMASHSLPGENDGSRRSQTYLPIKLDSLTFSYGEGNGSPVLRDLTLDIVAGQCTAIVGFSGCGKSTLLSILLGLYTPPRPRPGQTCPLTYGDAPFTDIGIRHLHSVMSYVPQSPYLFPASVADNIIYGLPTNSPQRSMGHIRRAAKEADIHDFVASLPQGYDTLIGDGGQTLSGGQAQRINIARALVRRPQLLVLDEPTSALDAESAAMVRCTVRALTQSSGRCRDMAVILVTHSTEMMRVADRIVMLDGGVKVEDGAAYNDLVQAGGPFARLVRGIHDDSSE